MDTLNSSTHRLRFESFNENHRTFLKQLFCSNERVMSTALSGKLLDQYEFEVLINERFNHTSQEQFGFLTIKEKVSDKLIGVTGIFECDYLDQKGIEFGFILDQKSWGKGYATEIGSFWIDYILNYYPDHDILATTKPDNLASKKVLEKLNLIFVKNIEISNRGMRGIYQYNV